MHSHQIPYFFTWVRTFSQSLSCICTTDSFSFSGAVAEMLSSIAFICTRSIISKTIPSEDLGAVNSVIGSVEAFVPLIYGPLYNKIYAATLSFFPGAFYLLTTIMMVPAIFMFM